MAIFAPPLRRSLQELRDEPEGRVVRKPVRSSGWDGGGDLSGGVDTAATVGYLLDYANDAAQFETLYANGAQLGTWSTWSPTYANITIGNGTVVSRSVQIGNLVALHFSFTLGSTSAIGTDPRITPPVTASSTYTDAANNIGNLMCKDATGSTLSGYVRLETTTSLRPVVFGSAGTYVNDTGITATVPFTWTTSDILAFTAILEAA